MKKSKADLLGYTIEGMHDTQNNERDLLSTGQALY